MSDSSANWLDHIGSDSHSDHEAEAAESSIGPVRTGATFEYALEGCARLRLLTDNAKVHPLHGPHAHGALLPWATETLSNPFAEQLSDVATSPAVAESL